MKPRICLVSTCRGVLWHAKASEEVSDRLYYYLACMFVNMRNKAENRV